MEYSFKERIWEYQGQGSWHFLNLPKEYADDIKEVAGMVKKGFGSVRVEVTIGSSIWRTSLFPDKSTGSYILPVKKSVRAKENISDQDEVEVSLRIIGLD